MIYTFIPTDRGDLRSDLFKSEIHASIKAVFLINKNRLKISDLPYKDLSDNVLRLSLNEDIIAIYSRAKRADGTSLLKSLLAQVRDLLISDRLDQLNYEELYDAGIRVHFENSLGSNLGIHIGHRSFANELMLCACSCKQFCVFLGCLQNS